jgi:hypothetical protein
VDCNMGFVFPGGHCFFLGLSHSERSLPETLGWIEYELLRMIRFRALRDQALSISELSLPKACARQSSRDCKWPSIRRATRGLSAHLIPNLRAVSLA